LPVSHDALTRNRRVNDADCSIRPGAVFGYEALVARAFCHEIVAIPTIS
jgi:hypothetical protein